VLLFVYGRDSSPRKLPAARKWTYATYRACSLYAHVQLSVNTWYSAMLLHRWIESVPRGEKSRALRLPRSAHSRELLAIWGIFGALSMPKDRTICSMTSQTRWLIFHGWNFRNERISAAPSFSFIIRARTKLSFVHYIRQFPWCAVRPARNFGTSGFLRAPGVSARFYCTRNITKQF